MIYEPSKGHSIHDSAKRAIEEAINCDCRVMLVFNNLMVCLQTSKFKAPDYAEQDLIKMEMSGI